MSIALSLSGVAPPRPPPPSFLQELQRALALLGLERELEKPPPQLRVGSRVRLECCL